MDSSFEVLFAIYAALLALVVVLSRVPAFQRWQVTRLGQRVGLGVPLELDSSLRRRLAGRLLASSLGGLVGLGVGTVVFVASAVRDDVVGAYLVLALTVIGTAVGTAVASLHAESRPVVGPRIARSEAVGLGDYIIVLSRILAWSLVAVAVVTLIVATRTAFASSARIQLLGAGLAALGVVMLAAFEVVARRIVGRGRPAASTDELVWNDALTSSALRDMLGAPVMAVSFGALYSLFWSDPGAIGVVLGILLAVTLVAFGIVYRSTPTWYLTQLWPGARRRTPAEEAARVAAAARQ